MTKYLGKGVLLPGTVVASNYVTLNGEHKVGLFLVIYDEQLDASNNFKGNVLAFKITTSYKMITNYCVPLLDDYTNFLEKDCAALCSKIILLDKANIFNVIGELHPYTFRQVFKCYKRFESELNRQIEDYI